MNRVKGLVWLASVLLVSCGQAQLPGTTPQNSTLPTALRLEHHSWMRAGLATKDLMYVADKDSEVTVYDYATRALVGVLTGFSQPMGECVSATGSVYVTDYAAQKIYEYRHGGTKAVGTLNDAPDSPYTCAVDPTTGNLAVANYDGASKEGNVKIWSKGSGKPATYADANLYYFRGCAYDDHGMLLVTNGGYDYSTGFAWLGPGGSKLVDVAIPGPKAGWKWYVTGLQWDGKFFVIDDYGLYRVSVMHGQAYYIGETQLSYSTSDGTEGPEWIYDKKPGSQGTQVIGGIYGDYRSLVEVWQYPAGGKPLYSTEHGVDHPFGVTISLAN